MGQPRPKVMVLRTAGTNCDAETAFAFQSCGARVDVAHINALLKGRLRLREYHILAIPGGFTYGDDIESGRILANELRLRLGAELCDFIGRGRLMIGICNGFQVMVKAGILPGPWGPEGTKDFQQQATLTNNDSGKFEARWVYLKKEGRGAWLEGIKEISFLPVAHAEGKFIPEDENVLKRMRANGQIAFRYCRSGGEPPSYPENPNGSIDQIAGITDRTGRVLGLMPHPERHFLFFQHPQWTRMEDRGAGRGDGAKIFQSGIAYVKENLM